MSELNKAELRRLILSVRDTGQAGDADSYSQASEFLEEFLGELSMRDIALSLLDENEALIKQVAALQSYKNSWQSGYDKGREMGAKHRAAEVDQLRAELEALRNDNETLASYKFAYLEWSEKTDWVQETIKPKDLGRHRADVIFDRVIRASEEASSFRKENQKLEARLSRLAKAVGWFQLRHISVTKPKWLLSILAKEGSANG